MMTLDNNISIARPANRVPGPHPQQGQWTYTDYAALPDDGQRYEIMNGVLIMAPAPIPEHQRCSARLTHYLLMAVDFVGLGAVIPAPLDVELTPDRVVQPDVTVLLTANLHKIQKKKIVGSPDLVVEIASPGTALYDRLSKYEAYEQAGVSEYWLVDPDDKSLEVHILKQGKYESQGILQGNFVIPSQVVPGMTGVLVEQIFVQ